MPIYFSASQINQMIRHETPATLATKKMSIVQSGPLTGLKVEQLPLSEHPRSGASVDPRGRLSLTGRYTALARENAETIRTALMLIEERSKLAQSRARLRRSGRGPAHPQAKPGKKANPLSRKRLGNYRPTLAPIAETEGEAAASLPAATAPLAAAAAAAPDQSLQAQLETLTLEEGQDDGKPPPAPPSSPVPPGEESMDVDEAK